MQSNIDINTSKTYVTVGLVFYGLTTCLWLVGIIVLSWALSWASISWDVEWYWYGHWNIPWVIIILIGLGFLANIILTIWAYFTKKKIDEGFYAETRTASLVLGIFGLFPILGSFIGGIFFLLAYGKLGDVLRGPITSVYPVTPEPVDKRFCIQCGRAVAPNNKFCSHCGGKLPE
ncbi:MAG: zinc ribbon domain-containing protein [Candidatus Heimdallarchaeota archaeon]